MRKSPPPSGWQPVLKVAKFIFASCLLGLMAQIAHAAPRHVLLLTPSGSATKATTLAQQASAWQKSGLIVNALVFFKDAGSDSAFNAIAILELAKSDDETRLSQVATAEFGSTVDIISVDAIGEVGTLEASAAAVYVIMQYTVAVPRTEFEEYINGYQVPEMVARQQAGGLSYYQSFYVLDDSKALWRSILLMEYRTQSDLEDSGHTNSAIGEHLANVDPTFKRFKDTKNSIRTKISTVLVHPVSPP